MHQTVTISGGVNGRASMSIGYRPSCVVSAYIKGITAHSKLAVRHCMRSIILLTVSALTTADTIYTEPVFNRFLRLRLISEQLRCRGETEVFIFSARCNIVQKAVLRSHVVCSSVCLSVCLSVTLVDQDQLNHIGWTSWKVTARTISPTHSLLVAQRPSTYSKGNMVKFLGGGVGKKEPVELYSKARLC